MQSEFTEDYLRKGMSINASKPSIKELHSIGNWLYINEYIRRGYFTYEQLSDEQRGKCSLEQFNRIKNQIKKKD